MAYLSLGIDYDINFFHKIKNPSDVPCSKPIGGLWASTYTPNNEFVSHWAMIAMQSRIRDYSINTISTLFELSSIAKVFELETYADLEFLYKKYPLKQEGILAEINELLKNLSTTSNLTKSIDFETLASDYDAIHLSLSGLYATNNMFKEFFLYGWDSESLLVLNPQVIVNIQKVSFQ